MGLTRAPALTLLLSLLLAHVVGCVDGACSLPPPGVAHAVSTQCNDGPCDIQCEAGYALVGPSYTCTGTTLSGGPQGCLSSDSASCSGVFGLDAPGYDIWGGGTPAPGRSSARECAAVCDTLPTCVAWTWQSLSLECWVKNHIGAYSPCSSCYHGLRANGTQGPQDGPPVCSACSGLDGINENGLNLQEPGYSLPANSVSADCAQVCMMRGDECKAWAFDETDRVCYPKTSADGDRTAWSGHTGSMGRAWPAAQLNCANCDGVAGVALDGAQINSVVQPSPAACAAYCSAVVAPVQCVAWSWDLNTHVCIARSAIGTISTVREGVTNVSGLRNDVVCPRQDVPFAIGVLGPYETAYNNAEQRYSASHISCLASQSAALVTFASTGLWACRFQPEHIGMVIVWADGRSATVTLPPSPNSASAVVDTSQTVDTAVATCTWGGLAVSVGTLRARYLSSPVIMGRSSFLGSIQLPTLGGMASDLNYYEEFMFVSPMTAGGVSSSPIKFQFVRTGLRVTMTQLAWPAPLVLSADAREIASHAIPRRFAPSVAVVFPINIWTIGEGQVSMMIVEAPISPLLGSGFFISGNFRSGQPVKWGAFSVTWNVANT